MGQTGTINPGEAWNGTFAYGYVNGIELLTLKEITTTDEIEYEDIPQPGQLRDGRKMVKIGGKGEFTVTRVNTQLLRKLSGMIDKGLQPEIEIQATQDDPNSSDALYMSFEGCTIEKLDYIIAKSHEVVGETYPFAYSGRHFLN